MGNIQTVGPNEAMIVSGGCCRPSSKKIIVGGWCWNTWMLTNIQRLPLQIMTLNPKCEHVLSSQAVAITVTGVVHCKITSHQENLPNAAEQFLGKSTDQIKSIILHTIEGHMRAVIGTQKIEDICKKRTGLANMIRDAAGGDLTKMGIDILSLTIKDIKDDVEYLSSAGKSITASVKNEAAISAAQAEHAAVIVEAQCERERKELEIKMEEKIKDLEHTMDMNKASLVDEVQRIEVESRKAYDLQLARMQKDIREKEIEADALEADGKTEIKKIDLKLRKTELEMDEMLTKAKIYAEQKQSEAYKAKKNCETDAEVFRILEEGEARAIATRLEGNAEAEGMKLVAEARKEFNEAAVLFEVLKVLPDIAAEVASPLTKFEEIVLISDGKGDKSGKTPGLAAESAKLASSVSLALKTVGSSDRSNRNLLNTIMQLQKSSQVSQ